VYGEETRSADREISFESETTSTTEPETQIVASSEYPIGYVQTTQNSHTGYTAKLWKIVKENGVEVSRDTFNNSTYNSSPKIITVGIKSNNEEAVAAIKAAIATGNESTVRSVAAANSAEALAKQQEEEKKAEEEQQEEEKKKDDSSADDKKNSDKSSDKKKDDAAESKTDKDTSKNEEE
jgi:hypothetical protein